MLNNLISLIFARCLTMLLTFHELINRVSQPYWETFYFIHLGSTSKIQGDHSVPPLLTALFYMKYRTFRDFTFCLPHSSSLSVPLARSLLSPLSPLSPSLPSLLLSLSHTLALLLLYLSLTHTHKTSSLSLFLYLSLSPSHIHTHKLAFYLFLSISLSNTHTN